MGISTKVIKSTLKEGIFKQYTIRNSRGLEIVVLNYGGIIQEINIPFLNSKKNIVLGFKNIEEYFAEEYKNNCPYFGAIIGRYANRIAKGKFSIDGIDYKLACNNAGNNLHGGINGFDKQIWESEIKGNDTLVLKYISKDGEEGFPGNVCTEVHYTLTENDEIITEYYATSDKASPVNLTNHTYFNLSGDDTILNHKLQLFTDKLLESTEDLIPTGKIININKSTDFCLEKTIGQDITEDGYDHSYINKNKQEVFAILSSPSKDISMELITNQESVQLYSGKWIKTKFHKEYSGVALEPQAFPDSPNIKEFPNSILYPNKKYYHKTIYRLKYK